MGMLQKAELWFRRSAEAGHDFSQYTLAKLLHGEKRVTEAMSWYEKATAQGNPYAAYQLGKLYLTGECIPKDVGKAVQLLKAAAQQGNQYAQYALGKLYLTGQEVPRNQKEADYWLTQSAAQGNEYAQFFLCHMDQADNPNLLLSATNLLHHGQHFPGQLRATRKSGRPACRQKAAQTNLGEDNCRRAQAG